MKKLAACAALAAIITLPTFSSAQLVSDIQTQIQTLLQQIAQLQTQLGLPNTPQGGSGSTPAISASGGCPLIGRVLKRGSSGEDVKRLQQFLARDPSVYPEANLSGYYGALTEAAVKRWQTKFNIVSSGTGATTGFGVTGPRTAAAMSLQCSNGGGGTTSTTAPATVTGYIQVTPVSGAAPLAVQVQATLNSAKSCAGFLYTLDYGDGSQIQQIPVPAGACAQHQQTFTHTYQYGGSYQIKLASGGHQVTATVVATGPTTPVKPTRIITPGLPDETFDATPISGPSPLTVTFSGIVTSNDAGFCAGGCSAAIDFGDGTTDAIRLPASVGGWLNYSIQHTYTTVGGYKAILYQGPLAAQQPLIGTATIVVSQATGGTNPPPTSTYTYGPLSLTPSVGGNPQVISVQFDLPTSCTGYRLSWGDGTTDQMQSDGGTQCAQTPVTRTFQHTFASGGSYTVNLKRGANLGQVDTAGFSITSS